MKYENIILIPPNLAYGDCLSVIGLLYYLLNHYNKVYFYLGNNQSLINYYNSYFENDPSFNHAIFLVSDVETLIDGGEYGDYHICNTMTGDWSSANYLFYNLNKINKEYYFNDLNPIYNKVTIPENFICNPNKHLPSKDVEINHIFYYELIGLNNSVRMDYFNYFRNREKETVLKNNLLNRFGIQENEKYNVINDPVNVSNRIMPLIDNDYKTININYLANNPGELLLLLEDAETIHFVEGCNVNFYYHCQYKGLFTYNKIINFHIWARNRDWMMPNMNLDFAWKMMNEPKLDNWSFIFG
jgi:hypothetical protein